MQTSILFYTGDRRRRTSQCSSQIVLVVIACIAVAGCRDDAVGNGNANTADGGRMGGGSTANQTPGSARASTVHSTGGAGGVTSSSESAVGDRRIPFTPATDRAFVDFFIAHHQMAIMMAEHERTHGANSEVLDLAKRVIDTQQPEVDMMMAIAAQLTDPPSISMPSDPHADADMEHMSNISGSELDGMFLTEMIAHHAAGLPVAHRALTNLKRAELRTLATNMQAAQGKEIGEMQTLREMLSVSGAGEDRAPSGAQRADMGINGDMRISFTPATDREFIDFFVPHHQMAVDMAELVIARGQDAEVRSMAGNMRDAQRMEIDRMQSIRQSLAPNSESMAPPHDEHMDSDMSMMMAMSGTAVDVMFLREMSQHHAAGIPTAHRAKPHLQNADLKSMSDGIFETQSREVGEMQGLLERLAMQGQGS